MEAVETPQNTEDVRLLLAWDTEGDRARSRRAGTFSVAAHTLGIIILLSMPRQVFRVEPEVHHVTPLVAPPTELTQREPNPGKVSKSFNVESLQPRPRIQIPRSAPSRKAQLSKPAAKPSQPAPLPEPPNIEPAAKVGGTNLPAGVAQAPPPPPQIQPEEKPKLAFETPRAPPSGGTPGLGKVAPPSTSVEEAMRSVAQGASGGGIVVGDLGMGESGISGALNQPPTPARQGSNLQLLSDPMGADFKPYLLQILQTVRRNWFAVMPESAKLGRRGRVAIQFAIAKNGEVTKVVFATQSGVDSLDRAAVASISMSNPFPPLPAEYRGSIARLQFTFAYNVAGR